MSTTASKGKMTNTQRVLATKPEVKGPLRRPRQDGKIVSK
jgi:hypothetical protein